MQRMKKRYDEHVRIAIACHRIESSLLLDGFMVVELIGIPAPCGGAGDMGGWRGVPGYRGAGDLVFQCYLGVGPQARGLCFGRVASTPNLRHVSDRGDIGPHVKQGPMRLGGPCKLTRLRVRYGVARASVPEHCLEWDLEINIYGIIGCLLIPGLSFTYNMLSARHLGPAFREGCRAIPSAHCPRQCSSTRR